MKNIKRVWYSIRYIRFEKVIAWARGDIRSPLAVFSGCSGGKALNLSISVVCRFWQIQARYLSENLTKRGIYYYTDEQGAVD
jgi:hypothetical protein